jgi:hypothetical protein
MLWPNVRRKVNVVDGIALVQRRGKSCAWFSLSWLEVLRQGIYNGGIELYVVGYLGLSGRAGSVEDVGRAADSDSCSGLVAGGSMVTSVSSPLNGRRLGGCASRVPRCVNLRTVPWVIPMLQLISKVHYPIPAHFISTVSQPRQNTQVIIDKPPLSTYSATQAARIGHHTSL